MMDETVVLSRVVLGLLGGFVLFWTLVWASDAQTPTARIILRTAQVTFTLIAAGILVFVVGRAIPIW